MGNGNVPEAKCPKCGAQYFGWTLHDPRHQRCDNCGTQLEIINKEGPGGNNKPQVTPKKRPDFDSGA